jgi:hypothetical protein
MKAYGVPRLKDVEFPDCADICLYALKSSVGHLAKKSGDYASAHRSSKTKRNFRRIWKRRARAAGKAELHNELSH